MIVAAGIGDFIEWSRSLPRADRPGLVHACEHDDLGIFAGSHVLVDRRRPECARVRGAASRGGRERRGLRPRGEVSWLSRRWHHQARAGLAAHVRAARRRSGRHQLDGRAPRARRMPRAAADVDDAQGAASGRRRVARPAARATVTINTSGDLSGRGLREGGRLVAVRRRERRPPTTCCSAPATASTCLATRSSGASSSTRSTATTVTPCSVAGLSRAWTGCTSSARRPPGASGRSCASWRAPRTRPASSCAAWSGSARSLRPVCREGAGRPGRGVRRGGGADRGARPRLGLPRTRCRAQPRPQKRGRRVIASATTGSPASPASTRRRIDGPGGRRALAFCSSELRRRRRPGRSSPRPTTRPSSSRSTTRGSAPLRTDGPVVGTLRWAHDKRLTHSCRRARARVPVSPLRATAGPRSRGARVRFPLVLKPAVKERPTGSPPRRRGVPTTGGPAPPLRRSGGSSWAPSPRGAGARAWRRRGPTLVRRAEPNPATCFAR